MTLSEIEEELRQLAWQVRITHDQVLNIAKELPPDLRARPGRACGTTWIAQELNRRFGDRLRRQLSVRQVSAILRRLHRQGELELHRRGKPHHEARYSAA